MSRKYRPVPYDSPISSPEDLEAAGFTSPERYTHGTSEQRVKWFRLGLETGDMRKLKTIFQMPYNEL